MSACVPFGAQWSGRGDGRDECVRPARPRSSGTRGRRRRSCATRSALSLKPQEPPFPRKPPPLMQPNPALKAKFLCWCCPLRISLLLRLSRRLRRSQLRRSPSVQLWFRPLLSALAEKVCAAPVPQERDLPIQRVGNQHQVSKFSNSRGADSPFRASSSPFTGVHFFWEENMHLKKPD